MNSDTSPFRLLIVTTHIAPAKGYGGVAQSSADLALVLSSQGYDVRLVSSDASNAGFITADDVVGGGDFQVNLFRSRYAKRQGFGFSALPLIWRELSSVDGVYIAGVSTWPVTVALILCRLRRVPFIVGLRGGFMREHLDEIRARKPIKRLFYDLLVRPLVNGARAVHAMSSIEKSHAEPCFSTPIIVASLGVDCSEILPVHPPMRLAEGGCRHAFIGRFSPEKSARAMISRWIKFASIDDRLEVVGDGTSAYADEIKELANSDDRITMHGYAPRPQVLEILAKSHFLIMPSGMEADVRENFGIVVAEALALGRPVICARGLAWDDLETFGAGITFKPTEEAFADALSRATELTESEYLAMANCARKFVESRADLRQQARKLAELVRQA